MDQFRSVQSLSHVLLFVTPWTAAGRASLTITNSRRFFQLITIKSMMSSNHLILYCNCLLCLQSSPTSGSFPVSQFFTSGGQSIGVSASASVLPMKYSGLISFRIDWLDLLALQEILKSLLHHSSKPSILCNSAFFTVQFSHLYMTTGKTIALTRWTFIGKVMSLLFKMHYKLTTAFLPRSKCLLISWLQSSSAVNLQPEIRKSVTVSTVPHLLAIQ